MPLIIMALYFHFLPQYSSVPPDGQGQGCPENVDSYQETLTHSARGGDAGGHEEYRYVGIYRKY